MFFCKSCCPKVSLSLEIQDKQSELDERLQELESKLTSNPNVTEENNSSTADIDQPSIINTQNLQHDRKFNIAMHGIDECEKGAPRNE